MSLARLPVLAGRRAWPTTARRGLALLAAAVVLSELVLPWRPETLCLLRAATGLPCPFCGTTTAAVHIGNGDLPAALGASPLAVLGAAGYVAAPVAFPFVPRRLAVAARRHQRPLVALILVAAEIWQLIRLT